MNLSPVFAQDVKEVMVEVAKVEVEVEVGDGGDSVGGSGSRVHSGAEFGIIAGHLQGWEVELMAWTFFMGIV
jgi:hypothetical protein